MTPQRLILIFAIFFDGYIAFSYNYYHAPNYEPAHVAGSLLVMAAINFLFGIIWGGFKFGEKNSYE